MYEVMPIAALIGTIYALSKLAAQSEFTIMRVSGMSTKRLLGALAGIGLQRPRDAAADRQQRIRQMPHMLQPMSGGIWLEHEALNAGHWMFQRSRIHLAAGLAPRGLRCCEFFRRKHAPNKFGR
jgi:hypothetical protein